MYKIQHDIKKYLKQIMQTTHNNINFKEYNLFSILIKIYFFIVGFSWIALQLYFRLIAKKSDYNLLEIKIVITTKTLTLFSLFIILHFFIIISTISYAYRAYFKKNPSSIMVSLSTKLTLILDAIYWKPLYYIYDLIAPDIPGSGRYFLWLEKRWEKKKRTSKYFYTIIFLFDVLPKLIVAITFFIELIIFNRFHFFFYILFLMFFPIMLKIFLNLFIDFSIRNLPILQNYFSAIKGREPFFNKHGQIIGYRFYDFALKKEYDGVVDAHQEMLLILQLESIQQYGLKIKEDLNNITPYLTIITSLMYFIAGCYRLFVILI